MDMKLGSEHSVSEENYEEISSWRPFDYGSNCMELSKAQSGLNFSMIMISLPYLYSLVIV